MKNASDVLRYWLDEKSPEDWYKGGAALDAEIRDRFETTWQAAADGSLALWLTYPTETLAYIILTDQFSRNMFRGSPKAFSTDPAALAAAKMAINRDWDLRIDEPARQFFYMPLMHSESLCDQDHAVRLVHSRMPQTGHLNIDHAKAHRQVIRTFGRFPFRNDALSRRSTGPEVAFMENGGYGAIVRNIQEHSKALA